MAYSTINKSTDYQNTVLYTGNAGTQSITGVGFQPDLNWIKCRGAAEQHNLSDSVRGDSGLNTGYYYIESNSTAANGSGSGNTLVSSLDADGFSIGNNNQVNVAQPFVSWNWKANGSGSANTDGSISSTVSANATSKFSIVSYTGTGANATVGHGLGVVPSMMIFKNLSRTIDWVVYSNQLAATDYLVLNSDGAKGTFTPLWNSTAPTSSVFSVGTGNATNYSTENIIAYCFADVQGYSKFGSYTGNGVVDGTFIYTGFKPSWVLVKNIAAGSNWMLYDNKVIPYNLGDKLNRPNTNAIEVTSASGEMYDFLSNGFKARASSNNNTNYSGNTYIYMAFGQTLVGTNNIPATAR